MICDRVCDFVIWAEIIGHKINQIIVLTKKSVNNQGKSSGCWGGEAKNNFEDVSKIKKMSFWSVTLVSGEWSEAGNTNSGIEPN